MKPSIKILLLILFLTTQLIQAQTHRETVLLDKNWEFHKGEKDVNNKWESVEIPHDWAIYGPFDRKHDLQEVAVTQNLETIATFKTGRTGGLPYMGVGWYKRDLSKDRNFSKDKKYMLLFDGAMSEARVFIDDKEICFWPYGYNSFYCDITDYVTADDNRKILTVRLENLPQSSRWYPGAGLYRNVHLIETNPIHIPIWGTYITTENINSQYSDVKIKTEIAGAENESLKVVTTIRNKAGEIVATSSDSKISDSTNYKIATQFLKIEKPLLWSPESPNLYIASTEVYADDILVDIYDTRFGVRNIKIVPEKGFFLNGVNRKFQGVCLHHDLGPLGAAINTAALRRQLTMLKDMGCDAIRTSHNMPSPEQIALCDEMGFMVIAENFDEWEVAKCKNGYHRFFNEWAEKDMINMIRNYRNNPSVVMWSIGNEVPTQWSADGYKVATFLQDICHREDPTRPVTCGMDQITPILSNGFGAIMDVPGFNYRVHRYLEAYEKLPQKILLGSETASTVSSRGIYHFPVEKKPHAIHPDNQSSSYDLEYCNWSNVPDDDFAFAEDYPWTMGQFVWTGFDYLGEPSPYDTDAWPNHSSVFGIIDLASIPKDRYYLYRSQWNKTDHTLHVLPHWTHPDRVGEITPIFVYTDFPSAEVFINGVSQGRRFKNDSTLQHRFRLMWYDTKYEPGELRVVAYDKGGNQKAERVIKTAGKPYRIELIPDRNNIVADGKDLSYINVRIVDKDGNLCPSDGRLIEFEVKGAGKYRASANGDPTCLDLFHLPKMHAFSGQLTILVQSSEKAGKIDIEAQAVGLRTGKLKIHSSK